MATFLAAGLDRFLVRARHHPFDLPLGQYLDRQFMPQVLLKEKRPINCDPAIEDLRITVLPAACEGLQLPEVLWEILVKYHLGCRVLPDSTFTIGAP